jgi:hypothetical protein
MGSDKTGVFGGFCSLLSDELKEVNCRITNAMKKKLNLNDGSDA